MKRLRKVIFWCHLPVGVAGGLIILTMSVTGLLLTYEREIVAWADSRSYVFRPPSPGAARLPLETLLTRVNQSQIGATASAITLRPDPAAPVMISYEGGRVIFVDPYTGELLSEGSARARGLFRVITDLHRWLGARGENRAIARAVTGACNFGFMFLVVSGFYLWWPRSRVQVRNVIWFKRGLGGRARDFNWHNVIGFWSLVPLFIITLSGVVISYPWASNLVYRAVGEAPPPPRGVSSRPAEKAARLPADDPPGGLDVIRVRAEQHVSGWQSISMRLPTSADGPVTFTIDRGDGGRPHLRAQLVLDRKSGEVVRWEPFSSYTTGRRLRTLLRFAHTGEAAGIAGQTIAGLASAGGAVLVWTGLALALRRLRAWRARKRYAEPVRAVPQTVEGGGQQTA
jgi:uncharacterized iron-regulated membrane protein